MRIGTINMPGRYRYDGQSIQTRFFTLGLPLFPTGCLYKISDNLGIEIPLTWNDILHAYAKIHFGLIGLGLLFWRKSLYRSDVSLKLVLLLMGLVLIGISIYSWVIHYDVKKEELLQRRIFGKAFLYNMHPEYLPKDVQQSLFGELLKTYLGKSNHFDWRTKIEKGEVTKSNFPLLYTLAYYQNTIEPSKDHKALSEVMSDYLYKRKKLKNPSINNNEPETVSAKANFTSQPTNQEGANKEPNDKIATILKMMQEIEQGESRAKTAQSSNTSSSSKANLSDTSKSKNTEVKEVYGQAIKMSLTDVAKLSEAKSTTEKQMLMVFGMLPIALLVMVFVGSNTALLFQVFLVCVVIVAIIVAAIFLPGYSKIQKDIKYHQKMRVKVRVKDMAEEAGTTYLILKHNEYGIDKLTAPSKYYSTDLLNKELDIYVSKEAHTLLDIISYNY